MHGRPFRIWGKASSRSPIRWVDPGQVGLYRINVQIPAAVPSIPACTVLFSCINSLIGCVIQSNTTINIAGISSFDGAAICVQPPQSAVNVAKMPMFARTGYYAR